MNRSPLLEIRKKTEGAMYRFTLLDKVVGAIGALKIRFLPGRILLAGPYVGEFGHELMDWQAWIRAQVPSYSEVHVITYPGRDFLYPGCIVHAHDIPLEKAGYKFGRLSPRELAAMAHAKASQLGLQEYDLLTPQHLCTSYHQRYLLPSNFELLAAVQGAAHIYDVAFHFRRVQKEGPDQLRNYSEEYCDQLANLTKERGMRACCIGHPLYSYCPGGVEDLRSEDLAASVKAIASSGMLVGELSGPIHLAQLCGVPIVIWAPDQWRIDNCNRWNVFKVPTFVVSSETTSPTPESVMKFIDDSIVSIKAKKNV